MEKIDAGTAQCMALQLRARHGNILRAAKASGIPEPTLWAWCRGRKTPNAKSIGKLVKALEKFK
jgi:predicted transcriptional regulator